MANEAFQSGFNTGYGRADDERLHARALADQEHQQKVMDLISQRQELAAKIPTLVDDKGQPTPEYAQARNALEKVNLDIADAYHPAKNPGAIQKFGHLLTDHVGLTNPQERAQKEAVATGNKNIAAAQAADRQIAAAPLSQTQINAQKIQAQLKEINDSNLPEEDKAEARRRAFGLTNAKPNFAQFKLPDGTLRSYDLNHPESIPEGSTEVPKGSQTTAKENIAEYEEAKKNGYKGGSFLQWQAEQRRAGAPSTSANNLYAAAYQRAYGLKPEEMTPGDWDYIVRKQAYDKAIPQTTTTNTLKQNADQQWVPVQESNSKSPGGVAPLPPRGKPKNNVPPPTTAEISAADSPAVNVPAPMGVPPAPAASPAVAPRNPKALKKEVEDRDPRTSEGGSGRVGGANASVRVGDPVMAAPNKEYQDAKTAYDGAIHRKNLMHKNLADALKGNQQAMLSLVANHIGMTLGAQKGARINQAVWNEAVESAPWLAKAQAKWGPNGYLSGVTLAPEQMKQMVDLADESTDVTKQDLDRIHDRINEGVTSSGNKSPSAKGEKKTAPEVAKTKGTVSIAKAKTMPKYQHMTDAQISDAITKQGYLPIP